MNAWLKNITNNPKNDILSGLTVALALVPEAVAFAFVAGLDPMVGLYGAFIMGIITSVFGGMDMAPLILIFALQFLEIFVQNLFSKII